MNNREHRKAYQAIVLATATVRNPAGFTRYALKAQKRNGDRPCPTCEHMTRGQREDPRCYRCRTFALCACGVRVARRDAKRCNDCARACRRPVAEPRACIDCHVRVKGNARRCHPCYKARGTTVHHALAGLTTEDRKRGAATRAANHRFVTREVDVCDRCAKPVTDDNVAGARYCSRRCSNVDRCRIKREYLHSLGLTAHGTPPKRKKAPCKNV